jgi:hypothetical protein
MKDCVCSIPVNVAKRPLGVSLEEFNLKQNLMEKSKVANMHMKRDIIQGGRKTGWYK